MQNALSTAAARALLLQYIAADVPAFMWGAPGIGKSDLARDVAKALRAEAQAADPAAKFGFIDFRALLREPIDLRGLPAVDMVNRKSVWLEPDELPNAARDGERGILFMDELNAAPAQMQAACFGLILDRRVGDYELPPGWRIVAAGNRISDRAAAQKMPSALANRFAHIHVAADVAAWCDWATTAGVHPLLIAFIRFRPELLHLMPGGKVEAADKGRVFEMPADAVSFPTPRSWAQVSKFMDSADMIPLARGIVGEGPATELAGYVRTVLKLPRVADIIANPSGAPIPAADNMGALYALASGLARAATYDNFAAILTYAERLPAEFRVLLTTDATRRDSKLESAPGYTAFLAANAGIAA